MAKVKVVVQYDSVNDRYRRFTKTVAKEIAKDADARQAMIPEAVSGSSPELVNRKASRLNRRGALKGITELVEVSVKPSYSASRPRKVQGAVTYEQYQAREAAKAAKKAARLAK